MVLLQSPLECIHKFSVVQSPLSKLSEHQGRDPSTRTLSSEMGPTPRGDFYLWGDGGLSPSCGCLHKDVSGLLCLARAPEHTLMFPGDQRSPSWASLSQLGAARYFQKWLWRFRLVFCLLSGLTLVCSKKFSSLCLFKHFQWLSWILLFCPSLGFVVLSPSDTWFALPGLSLSYMCPVQPLDNSFFFFLFFSTECFYWMTWTFSLRLCLWHHIWCSCSWNCSTSVPSGEKATCVLVPVAAWCSSVRVWGRAHVWLPGAPASVSVGAHTCGCLVLECPCLGTRARLVAWCSSVRVCGCTHVWLPVLERPCLWPCHVWLPGAQASMSRDVRTWSFVVCLCLWCQWGATREVVLSVAVKLLFLLPWIIQRSITDVCQPQKLAQ